MNIFIKIMLAFLGIRIQKPVRRVSRGRSLKYTVIARALAGNGKKGSKRRKTKNRKISYSTK